MDSLRENEESENPLWINSQHGLIRGLPVEMLGQIIAFALPDGNQQPGEYYDALSAYRLVCRWFHDAIDRDPRFWTILTVDCWTSVLRAALHKSRKLPVMVHGQEWLNGDATPESFLEAVAPARSRMRLVSLAFRSPADAKKFFQHDTPNLTDADLAVVGDEDLGDCVGTFTASHLHSLRSLKLANLILDSGSPLCSCLVSLKLSNPQLIPLDRLLSALKEAPVLEELTIETDCWADEPEEPMQVTKIELNSLRKLRIGMQLGCNSWVALYLLSCIRSTSCDDLDVWCSLEIARPGPPVEFDPFGLRPFLRDLFKGFPAIHAAINSASKFDFEIGTGPVVVWRDGGSGSQFSVGFWNVHRKFDHTPVIQELLCTNRAKIAKLIIDEDFFRSAGGDPKILLNLGNRCIFQELELRAPGPIKEGLTLLKELTEGDGAFICSFAAVRTIILQGSAWSASTILAFLTQLAEANRTVSLVVGTSICLSAQQPAFLNQFSIFSFRIYPFEDFPSIDELRLLRVAEEEGLGVLKRSPVILQSSLPRD